MALTKRPRVRRLIERTARRALDSVGAPSQPAPVPPPALGPPPALEIAAEPFEASKLQAVDASDTQACDFARQLQPGHLAGDKDRVSDLLAARLTDEDLAELERRLADSPELQAHYLASCNPKPSGDLVLAYGVWLEVPSVIKKAGLTADQPPENVHAMARGPLSAAGGLYEANMVADALGGVGVDIADVGSALDFGCSSGRVVRVLAAAYPDIHWHACDPNTPAIAWATENLPGIEFFVNDDAPPLPLADGSLDLAYAISIWSHFAPELGLRWFEEMRRLLRPGGHLVCTTHGLTSIAHYANHELRTPEQSEEIRDALYRDGHWYAPEFGEQGDWGVVNPDWGTAFLSPEWMLAKLCPDWRVLEFAPGRNQENQDVYVLQRV
jgi:SAM-dependent methyltransferase